MAAPETTSFRRDTVVAMALDRTAVALLAAMHLATAVAFLGNVGRHTVRGSAHVEAGERMAAA